MLNSIAKYAKSTDYALNLQLKRNNSETNDAK